uniref:Uncharacterized protein n=1 Tax=Romanomermis culicivorax TaxID=13658 RepID=A0A915HH46_ROMCU
MSKKHKSVPNSIDYKAVPSTAAKNGHCTNKELVVRNGKALRDNSDTNSNELEGDRGTFRREMGLFSVISYLIGGIIGTGIFISPSGVLEHSGSPGMALIVWVSCGFVALLTALCYAELGTSYPHSGSSYYYVKIAFGDFAAFVFEWVDIILRKSTTGCVRYMTFSIYFLQPFFGSSCSPTSEATKIVAAVAIVCLAYINCQEVRLRAGFQAVTSCAKLLAMALIFALGLYYLYRGGNNHLHNAFYGSKFSPGSLATAFSYGLYAYSGWDVMNNAVEEIKNPNVSLPLGLLISIVLATTAYAGVNLAYFFVLDRSEVLDSPAVATVFAAHFTTVSAWLVSMLVSVSAIGACNALVFQSSRYLHAAAREDQLPKFVAGLSPRNNVPQPAIVVQTVLTLLCLFAKDINQLMVYYGILKWSMVALPISAQIYLRCKYPHIKRPLKFSILLPILTLIIMLGLLILPIYQNLFNSMVAIGLCSVCVPVYLFFFSWKSKPEWLKNWLVNIDHCTAEFFQKLMLVVISTQENLNDKEKTKLLGENL